MPRVLELREALLHLFQNEFQNRDVQNVPTQLEKLQLTDDNFDQLENIEYVLRPFKDAQMALEGEYYVNISLLPLVIHEMKDQLGICEAAVNPNTQQHLQDLLGKMQEDFHEHWGIH